MAQPDKSEVYGMKMTARKAKVINNAFNAEVVVKGRIAGESGPLKISLSMHGWKGDIPAYVVVASRVEGQRLDQRQ